MMCNIEHLLELYQSGKVSFTASEDAMFEEIINLKRQLTEANKRVGELEKENERLRYILGNDCSDMNYAKALVQFANNALAAKEEI